MSRVNSSQGFNHAGRKVKNLFFVASTLMMAGAAMAADGVVATLEQPLAARREVIVESALFRCEGTTCVLSSHSDGARSTGTCHALELKVGTVASYVVAGKPFEADKLAKCNGH